MTLGRLFFQKRPHILVKQIKMETEVSELFFIKLDLPYRVINKSIWAARRQKERGKKKTFRQWWLGELLEPSFIFESQGERINQWQTCSECWSVLHMNTRRIFFSKYDHKGFNKHYNKNNYNQYCQLSTYKRYKAKNMRTLKATSICLWTFIFETMAMYRILRICYYGHS